MFNMEAMLADPQKTPWGMHHLISMLLETLQALAPWVFMRRDTACDCERQGAARHTYLCVVGKALWQVGALL